MKVSSHVADSRIDADRLRQMNRRKEQNRNAQRRLRERKEEYTSQLEAQLTELHRHSRTQEDESRFLREALERMRSENNMLTQQIAMIHQSVPSTQESHPLPQRASIDLGTNHFVPTSQVDTRSRSQSEASRHYPPYAHGAVPSTIQRLTHPPSPASHARTKTLSASPVNKAMPMAPSSQTTSPRSPSTNQQDGPDLSPFDSANNLRSGSEQTESTAPSSNHSCFADVMDVAPKSHAGTSSRSSYSSQPASDGLMTNCLESIYTQPASRHTSSMPLDRPNHAAFDFATSWTPSTGDYAADDLTLSDFKSLDSTSASRPFGVTPGALGLTGSDMPSLGPSGEGWTISPWLSMGNTPSGGATKFKADIPDPSSAAVGADKVMNDDRHTSLASRRGFSRTLTFEQASF